MGSYERDQASDEGERSHQDGAQAHPSALDGGLAHRSALMVTLNGELDDEHSVLAQEAHQHDQTDLRVDVVGEAHLAQLQERAQDPRGQREQHREWQHETLVLSG